MRRAVLLGLILVIVFSGLVVFELITEPTDIDVSDCKTQWRHGRVVSVMCPTDLSR